MKSRTLTLLTLLLLSACSSPAKSPATLNPLTDLDQYPAHLGKTVVLTGTAINYAADAARPAINVRNVGRVLLLDAPRWNPADLDRPITASGTLIDIEAEEPNFAEPMQYPHPDYGLKAPSTHFTNNK